MASSKKKDTYSDEQSAVIYANFRDIMIVMAYAGTGKSFTLKQFCKVHSEKTFLYFVYNASMKKDALSSFKDIDNVIVTTFHGIAKNSIAGLYANIQGLNAEDKALKIEAYQKILDLRLENSPNGIKSTDVKYLFDSNKISEDEILRYANALLLTLRDFTSSQLTIEEYLKTHQRRESLGVECSDYEMVNYALNKLPALWEEVIQMNGMSKIPFEHDIYLKLYQLKKVKLDYHYILVDESQDISHVMIGMVMTQTHAKKIFVGDTYQSIYSWRGAVNSLEYLIDNYSPDVFFLSKSFRCPPKVAMLANHVIKLAGAKKEFVGVATPCPVTKQVTYIARTNSGLFNFCVEHIDKKIHFVGGIASYGFSELKDIRNLLNSKHEYISNDFIKKFADFKEYMEFAKKTADIATIGKIGIVLKYMKFDIFAIIKTLKEECNTPKMINADIVVTTGHKSKGLEWAQVELLDDFPFGNEKKMERMTESDLAEELRLLYVAITRAQNNVRLPLSILEYLEMGESSEYLSTYQPLALPDIDSKKELNEGRGHDAAETAKIKRDIGLCNICNTNMVHRDGNIYECQDRGFAGCGFKFDINQFYIFLKRFSVDSNFSPMECDNIIKSLMKKRYKAKDLISNKGKAFDSVLGLENTEKYGWSISFVKKK